MSETIGPAESDEQRSDWLRQPGADRPTYDCPTCGERSMQFFRILQETPQSPERTDSYVCFACGRAWQM